MMKIKAHKTVTNEDLDTIIDDIITRRAGENKHEFLYPQHPDSIPFELVFIDPKEVKVSLKKLITLLKNAFKQKDTIVVYGDYDADGVCATAIMWETIHMLGISSFPFIPNRRVHGYGLSEAGIDAIVEKYNPKCIITVDNGISAHDAIAYAKKKGIDVVVTDHHINAQKKESSATLIFHSTLISGSGLSYFIAREIVKQMELKHTEKQKEIQEDHILFATIGSIADMVPVLGPTRNIIAHGLKRALSTKRFGIRLMMEDRVTLNSFDVGYIISPKINVFGRIDDPMDALRLLCTNDIAKAHALFAKSQTLTQTRQNLVFASSNEHKKYKINDAIVAIVSDDLDEGIIGLVAADCLRKCRKPSLVLCKSNGFYKGSMRSTRGVDAAKLLSKLSKFTISSGGHAMAGGFVIKSEDIDEFLKEANDEVTSMEKKEIDEFVVDVMLPISHAGIELVRKLVQLEPFGPGNEMPLFATSVTLGNVLSMGKTKKHARIKTQNAMVDFVYFNGFDEVEGLVGKETTVVYQLELDTWGGIEKPLRKVITIIQT